MVYPNKQKNQKNIQQETIEKTPIYTKQNKTKFRTVKMVLQIYLAPTAAATIWK